MLIIKLQNCKFHLSTVDKRTYFKRGLIESSKSMFYSFRKSKPNKKELFRTKSESGQVEMSLLPSFHFSQRENKANDELTFRITFDFTPFRHLTLLLVDENWFSDFYGKRITFGHLGDCFSPIKNIKNVDYK